MNLLSKNNEMVLGIIGSGGFGRECLLLAKSLNKFDKIYFVEFDDFYKEKYVDDTLVLKLSDCDLTKMSFVVAVGNPNLRKKIISELPSKVKYTSLISKLSFFPKDVKKQEGLIVMPFCYLTSNISLGKHVHINSHCTIGHDSNIGDFNTLACSVMISGNTFTNELVYFGMNSCTKQGVKIAANSIIGLNSGVTKNLNESGVYIGTPAKILTKKI